MTPHLPAADADPSTERIPSSVLLLNTCLTSAAIVFTLVGADQHHRSGTPAWTVAPLLAALVLAGSLRVAYRHGAKIEDLDVFEAVLAPVLLLFDVLWVVALVVVAKVIAETMAQRRFVKAWFNVAQWAVAAAAGATALGRLDAGRQVDGPVLALLVVAMVIVAVVNHAALVMVMSLATRASPRRVLHDLRPAIISGWLLGGAFNIVFGLLLAAAAAATPLITTLFVVPLVVLHVASKHLALEASRNSLRRSVQDANAVLSRAVDPSSTLEPFLAVILDAFSARAVNLILLAEEGSEVNHLGVSPGPRYEHRRAGPVADGLTSLRHASVLRPEDGAAAPLDAGWDRCLAAPVRIEERTLGVLCVMDPQGFSRNVDDDLAALEAMADGAADSLRRAEKVDEGFAAHRRSQLLLAQEGQVLRSIASGDGLAASLAEVVDFVQAAVSTARCVIVFSSSADDAGDAPQGSSAALTAPPAFDVLAGDGPTPPASLLVGQRTTGERSPDFVIVPDVRADPRWNHLSDQWMGFRSSWAAPVDADGLVGTVGAVCLAHPEARAPTDDERAALAVARHLAGLAVERAVSLDQLLYQARHDRLTGLGNHTAFLEETDRALVRRQRTGHAMAVLFMDLDGFKYVNDTMGHDAGDALLVAVANRLKGTVRFATSVGRYGGDEFTVLCEDLGSDNDAITVAERIARELGAPYTLKGVEMAVTGSIGVALADRHITAAELIERADAAMYRAKERGRNRIEIFDERTRESARRRLSEQTALRQALDADEFVVHYQPLVSLSDLQPIGVEALVRWRQPNGSILKPDNFIGLAEDTGLIVPLGSLVLNEACRQAQRWRTSDPHRSLSMSVNVSARQISQGGFVDTVARALRDSGLPADALTLEITETALMEATQPEIVLSELRDLGVVIAIDDFGTGYASLDYLRRLPFDVIKLDHSFLQELATDRVSRAIVSSVVNLARSLGLAMVAEGIESEEVLLLARDLGCSLGQGFHLGQPVDSRSLDLSRPDRRHADRTPLIGVGE